LRLILEELIPGNIVWEEPIGDRTGEPYGVWLEGMFTPLIVVLKKEQGLGGDPFLQGLLTYGKVATQESVCYLLSPIKTTLR
jgi:hypothetical protein